MRMSSVRRLANAIQAVEKSSNEFKTKMKKKIIAADDTLNRLNKLKMFCKKEGRKKVNWASTCNMITTYKHPVPLVHQIMGSVALILGHSETDVQVRTGYNHTVAQ